MKRLSLCLLVASPLFLLMALALFRPPASFSAGDSSAVVAGNTAFALDLYQREKEHNRNLFFSPYSISAALAMTATGARGQTETEIASALHFSSTRTELASGFSQIAQRLTQIAKQKRVRLHMANSLWCEKRYPFNKDYLELNRKYFSAEVRSMDFAANPNAARETINSWIARRTQDKIRDLVQAPEISPLTTLVLCNAIYFKGDWATRFNPKATAPQPFFLTRNEHVDAPMMSGLIKVRVYDAEDAVVFALPYRGDDLSMVVVLPSARDGLTAVEKQLSAATLQQWLTALDAKSAMKASVVLPKFKLTCRLSLAEDLKAMGMPTAFTNAADFTGISAASDLFISDVVHQAFVEVNEEGTEAAAATAVTTSRSTESSLTLQVDHPFLFLIRERQSGTVLFMGRLTDPTR